MQNYSALSLDKEEWNVKEAYSEYLSCIEDGIINKTSNFDNRDYFVALIEIRKILYERYRDKEHINIITVFNQDDYSKNPTFELIDVIDELLEKYSRD